MLLIKQLTSLGHGRELLQLFTSTSIRPVLALESLASGSARCSPMTVSAQSPTATPATGPSGGRYPAEDSLGIVAFVDQRDLAGSPLGRSSPRRSSIQNSLGPEPGSSRFPGCTRTRCCRRSAPGAAARSGTPGQRRRAGTRARCRRTPAARRRRPGGPGNRA